jgi:drug/metabolite transporter (DMT)-like permease
MTQAKPRSRSLIAHLLLLAVVLVWGTTFSLVKSALAHTTPLLFNLLRMALAFVALVAVNAPSLRGITRRELQLGALTGLFLALGYQLQTAGLARTTPTKSAFLTGLVVVIVPLLSAIPGVSPAGTLKPTLDTWLGALLAFAGLLLLTTPAGSGAALFSGLGLGGTLQIGFAALIMLITLPLGGRPMLHSAPILWITLGVTALLATAAAFTIQSWAQQHLPASHTALIFTLEPVFAWLTSLLFFGEHLGTRAMLGAGLILAGILLAELRPTSRPGAGLLPLAGA